MTLPSHDRYGLTFKLPLSSLFNIHNKFGEWRYFGDSDFEMHFIPGVWRWTWLWLGFESCDLINTT